MRIETKHLIIRSLTTANVQNKASCVTLERAGFTLFDTRMYQDMFDETARISNFYELKR